MNLIALVIIMALAALTVSSSDSVPMKSVCVIGEDKTCWIHEEAGDKRELRPGDYCMSPDDMNRTLEKLKAVQ